MSSLSERLIAHLGPPSDQNVPAGSEEVPLTITFKGWQVGAPIIAGPHTFTLYVSVRGEVWEYQRTVVEGTDTLRWSGPKSLPGMEHDLAATARTQTAMGTPAAPGWSALRDRVAALRRLG